ncbi:MULTISPECIES: hypothetical protein [Morganellaceae]|uniref:hypothetical protein n=1 Tax=Morganellaceae TaxID=1903414 RepID=UPI0018E45759|nr:MULTISPECIES: hypothetical protein [Morganellaceae]MBI6529976.1 hypothetical protein [Proteus vulgaris]MBP6082199.1 hypothetical protein [Providencia sp.]
MTIPVVFIEPKFINNTTSYWAMFYAAIFKALSYQTNMLHPLGEQSPKSHRGDLSTPSNYLARISSNLQNHAFEYLMIDLLCSEYGSTTRDILVNNLLFQYGITDFEYKYLNLYKMGKDSIHHKLQLDNSFDVKVITPINPKFLGSSKNKYQAFTYPIHTAFNNFPYSDLLLIVSDGKKHTYGFLGEIEGNNGQQLFRKGYWGAGKGDYATFAMGISPKKSLKIDGHKHQLSNSIVLFSDENNRLILNYSNFSPFAKDYFKAINNMELFFNGQTKHLSKEDKGHEYIIDLIKYNWDQPSGYIIELLSQHVKYTYDPAFTLYNLPDPEMNKKSFKPNFLALVNSYCLYRVIP